MESDQDREERVGRLRAALKPVEKKATSVMFRTQAIVEWSIVLLGLWLINQYTANIDQATPFIVLILLPVSMLSSFIIACSVGLFYIYREGKALIPGSMESLPSDK